MGAETEDVIIGIITSPVRQTTEGAGKEGRACGDYVGCLAGVIANCPVALMEEFFEMAQRALGRHNGARSL